MKITHWKALAAETLGTATLTCAVLTSINSPFAAFTPVVAGLTLGLFVYTVGAISGAHLNPAVTFSLWSIKKIETADAIRYVLAQVIGAVLSMYYHLTFLPTTTMVTANNTLSIAMAEAVGTFVLVFGICSVVHKKVETAASGLVIGGSLTLGVLLASAASNGVLNPAVAIGIASVSPAYLFAPFVGGAFAAWLYRWLVGKA